MKKLTLWGIIVAVCLFLLLPLLALADVAVKGKNGTTVDATANGLKVDATISSGANVTITGLPAVTQGTSPWVTQDNHTTAVAPLSCRLTDGASFYSLGAGLTDAQLRATPVPVSGTVGVTGTFWQATQPVSGTFWQATQPVSAAALPLPTGASTEATLSTLNGKVPANLTVTATRLLVDGSGVTQPVSGTVTVTPSGTQTVTGTVTANLGTIAGVATETTLSSINTKTPTQGQALMAASSPVVIASNQSAVPVSGTFWQGTQPVSGTFWQATQPVSSTQLPAALGPQAIAGSMSVAPATSSTWPVSGTFWQATQPVSIASMPSTPVTGTFWQATQPVSGTVTATQATGTNLHVVVDSAPTTAVTGTFWQATQPVSAAALPLPTGAATEATLSAASAKLPAALGPQANASSLSVTPATGATFPVSGTFWQATQPVSGTVTATGPVTDAQLRATPVPVSGTVTAANASVSAVASASPASAAFAGAKVVSGTPTYTNGNMEGLTLDTSGNLRVAGSFTGSSAAVGTNGAAAPASSDQIGWRDGSGNLQPVSAANPLPITGSISATNPSVSATGAAVPASGTLVMGTDAGTARAVKVNAAGNVQVDVVSGGGSNASVGTTGAVAPASATYLGVKTGANLIGLTTGATTAANSIPVTIASDQSALTFFNGTADAGNSSTANLGIGATFTGTALNVFNQSTTQVWVFSNVNSATNGVSLQFSSDGTNWDEVYTQTFTSGGQALILTVPVRSQYFRIVYTNGGVAQASFRLYTIHKIMPQAGDVVELADTVRTTDHGQIVRAVLTAVTPSAGTYGEVVTHGTDADAEPTRTVGALETDAHLRLWNGTTFDRWYGGGTNADAVGTLTLGAANDRSFLYGWNGTTWDRLRSTTANGLAVDVTRVTGNVAVTGTFWQATQPVSGTVTANAGTGNFTVTQGTGTNLHAVIDTGSTTAVTQATAANLNATVVQGTAANLRAQTAAEQTTASATGTVASLTAGAVTTAAPTYTTGQANPLSLNLSGGLRVDGSGVTQPVSGTFWQATQPVSGTVTVTGVATETTLAAASAKLPAALGPQLATAALATGPSTVATAIDAGTCANVTASTTVAASNAARKVLIIYNNGTAKVHIKLGATATTANPPLAAGQSFTIEGASVYTGVVDVIASTGTQSVCTTSW